jgi:hypothetical protein
MLENLHPADKIEPPRDFRPGVTFDGSEGVAITPGFESEPDFDQFLRDAGHDPEKTEVIGPMRTSRWQAQKDGEVIWLTSYRFHFKTKTVEYDLPLATAAAKKTVKTKRIKTSQSKALIIGWSDLQTGAVDVNGGLTEFLARIEEKKTKLLDLVDEVKPEKIVFADLGDTIEGFNNLPDLQLRSNSLSLMDQVDLSITLAFEALQGLHAKVEDITYMSVGSNHCEFRVGRQKAGKPTDDWGVFIGRQLAKLSNEAGMKIKFLEPEEHEISLAHDVFGDGYHILGVTHGHHAKNINKIPEWWSKQGWGDQPLAAATILFHGHYHHVLVRDCGSFANGQSRFSVGASTLDNGSAWYTHSTGEKALAGLTTITLTKDKPYGGEIVKL